MRRNKASCLSPCTGATLIELLVVMFIISIMLGLLMPALQHARESANRTVCGNNLHNISVASTDPAPPDSIGGWSVSILYGMEGKAAADDFKRHPLLIEGQVSSFAYVRPRILTCPSAYDGKSDVLSLPVAHYVMATDSGRDWWIIGDAPFGCTKPWCTGPEETPNYWTKNKGPHEGGFMILKNGSVEYMKWE
jgi:Tfp pilus assembly protein PilV